MLEFISRLQRLLLVEYVGSTAIGHSTEGALARKDKHTLPSPVSIAERLKNVLDETNPTHAEVLNDIKRRFREETFTRESIAKVIEAYMPVSAGQRPGGSRSRRESRPEHSVAYPTTLMV